MMATAWDLLRGDTSNWEDRFFYRDLIGRYGQPVLVVGCGTGRLLLDYLAQDMDIDGVEVLPLMMVDNSTIAPICLTVPSNSPYDQEALSFSHFKHGPCPHRG